MTRPLFSILLPSRNRLELLRHAIDSVLGQDADLEIVVADNASDKSYSDYISSLGAIAVRSVRSECPLTVTENWNRALAASTGRYVIMMGDDDALVPGWLARATRLFRQFDEPDALYAMAYHYAYPGVVPTRPEGYLATVNNSELFRAFDQPYLLARKCALTLGERALRFRHRFSFNSQHFIWDRQFIELIVWYRNVLPRTVSRLLCFHGHHACGAEDRRRADGRGHYWDIAKVLRILLPQRAI